MPDDADDAGCRRSKRTRVVPLDWFRNERILYERRKSGEYNIICHLVVGAALRCWEERWFHSLASLNIRSKQVAFVCRFNMADIMFLACYGQLTNFSILLIGPYLLL